MLKLSKVYRYLLETRNESLSTVKEEIEFTRQYYFLQKIRFGEQLDLSIDVRPDCLEAKVPSISLQMLVENAIKHNQVTLQNPLCIKIYDRDECLIVEIITSPVQNLAKSLWAWVSNVFRPFMTFILVRNLYVIVKMDVTFVSYLF